MSAKREYGGAYVAETLMAPLQELQRAWERYGDDADYRKELSETLIQYAGRPTPLTPARNLAKAIGAGEIFLKREDLLHTGAHKLNNAIGQVMLAKRMGKSRIIAETGAGQHGVATATACAYLGLKCVIFMGLADIKRQAPNVKRIELLGARVQPVKQGEGTLKDAVNETLREWSRSSDTTHYCVGSAVGPEPFPTMVADLQSIIGYETQLQLEALGKSPPHFVIACVGGGSNAIGIFDYFLENSSVKLFGVEAEGASSFQQGRPGVLHGAYTYVMQTEEGQILPSECLSAGLDYPGVSPIHARLHDSGRVHFVTVTDHEAVEAMKLLSRTEGIIPALESSYALAYLQHLSPLLDPDSRVVVNVSGRGDKDLPALFARKLL